MVNAAVAALARRGQSIWLDDLSRELLTTGELARLIDDGVRGVTTNPSIFEQAIATSPAYDRSVERARSNGGRDIVRVYEDLVVDDVQRAADLLYPAYQLAGGSDGFVSLEVRPALSSDAEATFEEARRLWDRVSRPNLMIKLPATREGISVIPRLIVAGINVNATLIFSPAVYRRVAGAYVQGLEDRLAAGLGIGSVASVASFFVSRIDARVDDLLAKRPDPAETSDRLKGRAALALATLAYDDYCRSLATSRWSRLAQVGARPQRLLWASVGTKDPADPPTRYVRHLVYPGTVSTLPMATYRVFRTEAPPERGLDRDVAGADALLSCLRASGVEMEAVSEGLLADGVDRFNRSFDRLLGTLQAKLDTPGDLPAQGMG